MLNNVTNKFFGLWLNSDRLSQQVTRSSFLIFFTRFVIKIIYFLKTIILARLLFPEDFGLFALATLSMSLIEVFSQTGFSSALVQMKENVSSYLNTAWTVNFIRNIFLALVLFFVIAPFSGYFFQNIQVIVLVKFLSIIFLILSFENIGLVLLQKDLAFNKFFFYNILMTLFEVLAVIISAFILKNVWALIIGTIVNRLVAVILSYFFHPFRPRFELNLQKIKVLFNYGKWISLIGVVTFFVSKGDSIFIGKFLTVEEVGFYQLGLSLGILPATEIVRSLSSMLFPFFAKISGDKFFLREMFIKIARIIFSFSIPASLGLGMLSYQIVLNFYSAKWLPMIPILHVMIILGLLKAFELIVNPLFLGIGKPKISSVTLILQSIVMFLFIWPLTYYFGIVGTAWAVVFGSLAGQIFLLFTLRKEINFGFKGFFEIFILPTLASIFMLFILFLLKLFMNNDGTVVLVVYILVGVLSYLFMLFSLDKIFGRKIMDSLILIKKNI